MIPLSWSRARWCWRNVGWWNAQPRLVAEALPAWRRASRLLRWARRRSALILGACTRAGACTLDRRPIRLILGRDSARHELPPRPPPASVALHPAPPASAASSRAPRPLARPRAAATHDPPCLDPCGPWAHSRSLRGSIERNHGQQPKKLESCARETLSVLLRVSEPVEEGLRLRVLPRRAAGEHDLPR